MYGALDRFAQFFIDPLFLEETLDRELKAVDSENKKNLQNDTWRLHQLNKSTSNPQHPFSKFSTGNLRTLKDEPLNRGVKIREEFIRFHHENYSANRMKLAVLGKETLDELQQWTEQLFSPVENKGLSQNRWDDLLPFGKDELQTQVFAKPVMESRLLDIYFPYPDEEDQYESQPGRYLSHLIGHEGPGSLLAYIKSKGWANGLGCGPMTVCPGSAFFSLSIKLTEDGLKNYKEIVVALFQYIAMLREQPPQKWIFEEVKEMSEVEFKFKQKTPPSRTVSGLSGSMQKPYPRERLLSGSSVITRFDPEGIQKGLSYLRPDNFRLTIVSRDFPGDWDRKERWYGTEYKIEKLSTEFLKDLEMAASPSRERPSELHLPPKNEFIPTRLDVEKKEVEEPLVAPRLIRNDDSMRIWYKKDDRFWVPKANLHITLRNPMVTLSPRTSVITQLYTQLVEDSLEEYSYAAEIAGLNYQVHSHTLGLDVVVKGYNDKMSVLLEEVLKSMRDLEIKQDRFDIVKERLTRGYRNWDFQQPYQQIQQYSRWLVAEKGWLADQMLAELEDITADDVRAFFPQVLRQLHIEVLAHGNLHKEDALRMADMTQSILKPRTLPPSQWPTRRALVIPQGSNYVYQRTLKDPANVNHCAEYIMNLGLNSDRALRAKTLLLAQIADEPAFDQLRTKEQLGYIVFSGTVLNTTMLGFKVLIQSERHAEYLESRIDAFLAQLGKIMDEMTEEQFESHKISIVNKRLEKLKNLSSETSRFWNHIVNEFYDFEQGKPSNESRSRDSCTERATFAVDEDVAHLEPLTKADVLEFYNAHISPRSPTRTKLSVHMLAQPSPPSSATATTTSTTTAQPSSQELADKIVDLLTRHLGANGVATDADALRARFKDVDLASADPHPAIVHALSSHLLEDALQPQHTVDAIIHQAKAMLPQALPAPGVILDGQVDGEEGAAATAPRQEAFEPATRPVFIRDPFDFRASMPVSVGARPVRDLSAFAHQAVKL